MKKINTKLSETFAFKKPVKGRQRKRQGKISWLSVIFYLLSAGFFLYMLWTLTYSHNYLAMLRKNGQLNANTDLYVVVNYYVANAVPSLMAMLNFAVFGYFITALKKVKGQLKQDPQAAVTKDSENRQTEEKTFDFSDWEEK